ncbi:MAG TPA: rubrerythrin family protein [Methanothrix sp.]|nr:rubrerythrin family protein [Methanothrix sp.]HPT19165.1 rubrerythrin family protein [Methanothrix sp.]
MSESEKNLKAAFAGESQANRKYSAFAAKADKEGFAQAARLFRAAAAAEEVHAVNHLRALKAIKSTKDNLQAAISGEDEEWEAMYPKMIETARLEANKAAETSFHYANEVEKIHSVLYKKMLAGLAAGQESFPYYICPYCGNTVEKEAPGVCPVCGAEGKLFIRVD